jgi:cytidylate kinase
MNNTLMVYLNKRLIKPEFKYLSAEAQPGPVICISREVGCGALVIARQLAAHLDKQTYCRKWKVLSKEILEESARELDMEPGKLRSYMNEGDRTLFDDILTAFSEKRHKSDQKIRKTLIDLVNSFAHDGHCIIVGRAGHIICRDVERSLFVKLVAPLDLRIKRIMENNQLNMREALEFIEKTERERQNFIKHIAGDVNKEGEFDLTIDLGRIGVEKAVEIIQFAAHAKGLLETVKSKVEVF